MAAEFSLMDLVQAQSISALTVAIGFFVALALNNVVGYWRDKRTYSSMLEVIKNEAGSNEIILEESFYKFIDTGIVLRSFMLKAVPEFLVNPLFVTHAKKEHLFKLQTYQRNLILANLYREKSEKFTVESDSTKWLEAIKIKWRENLVLCEQSIKEVSHLI